MLKRIVVAAILCVTASPSWAAWTPPPGVDLMRPRILFRADDLPLIQARLERESYRRFARAAAQRIRQADNVALNDESINAHRIKARAARNLAFFYAVDRTVIDGDVIPFPDAEARKAAGDRVRDLLAHLFPRSRLALPAPLGGWDRDISTSEELLQYATAYDTMRGAGYDFGADDAVIVDRLADLASELYDNYVHPETAGTFTNLHNNNHRSKSGAALVVAALALAEYTPAPEDDPRQTREPTLWLEYGLDQVDLIMRYVLVSGDGAYGEGPFYLRYAAQNLLPFARAWDRLIDGRPYVAASRGLTIPSLWSHPLFRRTQRWELDMTLPDGSLAPIDDGNPGRSYYFGLAPGDEAAAFAWRWANAPAPYDTEGNVDLSVDAIVAYDDSVVPVPPAGSATAFYVEGGSAVFRSDWSSDAVMAVVQAEHDTASEFGRDRQGRGVGPQSHEHAEPGAFLLHAFGERLLLDPGYLDFANRGLVNRPQDHNIILVDDMGPVDYLTGSVSWRGKAGRPPVDGNAMLSSTLDSGFIDTATVTSRYGQPRTRAAEVERRFLFADDHYLVIADDVIGRGPPARNYTWLLHGNGGETSGGTFERTELGGRWTQGAARLDSAIAFERPPVVEVVTGIHENPGGLQATHSVLRASVEGETLRALQLVYPTRAQSAPAVIERLRISGLLALTLTDVDQDRRLLAVRSAPDDGTDIHVKGWDGPVVDTDGDLIVVDAHLDGSLRLAWAEDATRLRYGDGIEIITASRGNLGLRVEPTRAEVVADTTAAGVTIRGLPFEASRVDGGCGLQVDAGEVRVALGRERRFALGSESGNARPAADPGPDRVVSIGDEVRLDGSASCDSDGDQLAPEWKLVSAPSGSAWSLNGANEWMPALVADVAGPYRVRLTVTDEHEAKSLEAEVLVIAGPLEGDGLDNDADGLFDTDDPDTDRGGACAGDCTGEGAVTVDELVRATEIALGARPLYDCGGLDVDGDGRVTVEEIVTALDRALTGCNPASGPEQ